jgi:hypothetical protein
MRCTRPCAARLLCARRMARGGPSLTAPFLLREADGPQVAQSTGGWKHQTRDRGVRAAHAWRCLHAVAHAQDATTVLAPAQRRRDTGAYPNEAHPGAPEREAEGTGEAPGEQPLAAGRVGGGAEVPARRARLRMETGHTCVLPRWHNNARPPRVSRERGAPSPPLPPTPGPGLWCRGAATPCCRRPRVVSRVRHVAACVGATTCALVKEGEAPQPPLARVPGRPPSLPSRVPTRKDTAWGSGRLWHSCDPWWHVATNGAREQGGRREPSGTPRGLPLRTSSLVARPPR